MCIYLEIFELYEIFIMIILIIDKILYNKSVELLVITDNYTLIQEDYNF